jgi:hypothetical protein
VKKFKNLGPAKLREKEVTFEGRKGASWMEREREREMVRSKKTEKKVAAKRSEGPARMGPGHALRLFGGDTPLVRGFGCYEMILCFV